MAEGVIVVGGLNVLLVSGCVLAVSFSVLVGSVQVLFKLFLEDLVHVGVGACESACIQNIKDNVDEFLGDFLFWQAFFPCVACFAQFNEGEEEFFWDVFRLVVEAFGDDEGFDLMFHFFKVHARFLLLL